MVYSTGRSKAVVPVLVLLFVALWFILRGDLFYVLPYVILFLCFSVLLALQLPRLGKRQLILVIFVCLFDLCLFGFVCFLFLLVSGKGCGLWLWHSLDCSLTFFYIWNSNIVWTIPGRATNTEHSLQMTPRWKSKEIRQYACYKPNKRKSYQFPLFKLQSTDSRLSRSETLVPVLTWNYDNR